MKIYFYPFELKFRNAFSIAAGTRNSTPVVYTEIEHNGKTGYGEATLPPYLKETQESVIDFISKIDLRGVNTAFDPDKILDAVFLTEPKNYPAIAAIDMALHDLAGKVQNVPYYTLSGFKKEHSAIATYTIGISDENEIEKRVDEAKDFSLLKIKLGSNDDKSIIRKIRSITSKPLCVDVNQGWLEKEFALDMLCFLKEHNVVFIEQPLPKNKFDDALWLKDKSPLPLIADEAVQTPDDIEKIKDAYHGINIKLMKCGGLREAIKMINIAKRSGLKILIGCMSESSCGVSAAAQLASAADWLDLDGPLLISNNPFKGISYINGKIVLNDLPGIGVTKL